MIFNIQQFIDHDEATDIRESRRRGFGTQEFFTPYSIVKRMCDKISDDDWSNPKKTWLEPCMGDGNYDKLPIETAVNLMNTLVEYVYSLLDDYSVEDGYDAEGIVANTINHFNDNDNMQIMIQSFLIKTESDYVRNRYL